MPKRSRSGVVSRPERVVAPILSTWVPQALAPYFRPQYDVVDPGEKSEPPVILGLRKHGDSTALGQGLDHQHPGHRRATWEVAGQEGFGLTRVEGLAKKLVDRQQVDRQ